jgi:hypothetical protein
MVRRRGADAALLVSMREWQRRHEVAQAPPRFVYLLDRNVASDCADARMAR